MEPHELDKYIGNKLKEAEQSGSEGEINGMDRVWSTLEPQLEKQASFQWLKMAAVVLLLLMPSVYLYFRNREQGRQIVNLNKNLTLIEKSYRQKLQAFTVNQPDNVVVQHDTVILTRTVERKIIPETLEIVKYRTDTVIIYQHSVKEQDLTESHPDNSLPGEIQSAWQERPVMTEYILSKDASSIKKKKKNRSFQISLGTGNGSSKAGPDLAFKTKL
jgi:hypothetical protein